MSTLATRISGELAAARHSTWRLRALGIELALAVNILILAAARLVNGEFPVATVGNDEQAIGFVPVIVVTALAGLSAWGLLALLERRSAHAATAWTAIAVVVLAVSLTGPLGNGVDTASKLVLACLHLGAALPVIALMRRSANTNSA